MAGTLKLSALDPYFVKPGTINQKTDEGETVVIDTIKRIKRIESAQGVAFLCPVCFAKNGGRVGTHTVLCWALEVPQTIHPKPGRWKLEGTGFDDLTLVNGSSSVLLQGGCKAHFFIREGEIIIA